MPKENKPYSLLARFYDDVLPGMADMNRHARGQMLGPLLDDARVTCELACGSGSTAVDLARAGKRVYAIDHSAEFCRTVRCRARAEKLPIKVIRADMRKFRLPEPVDLVTCEFAALNNLADRRGLPQVFRAAYRALRPGGHFLFDVNTLLSNKEQVPVAHWMESQRFFLVMRGSLDSTGRTVRLDLEWFVPEGNLFRHVRETILNVVWTDREIRRALREAGFERPHWRDGMDVRPAIPGAKRGYDSYYLTRKPVGD